MSDEYDITDEVLEMEMGSNPRVGVAISCPVYRAAQLFVRAMAAVAGSLAAGTIADLVGISSFASNPGILNLLHHYTALVCVGIASLLALTIAAVIILRAPAPLSGGTTRLAFSVMLAGLPSLITIAVLLLVLLRPAFCPTALCPPPTLVTCVTGVHDSVLELCPVAVESSIYEIPGDPSGYGIGNLPESLAALRVDSAAQPPYRTVVGVHDLRQGGYGLIIEGEDLVVAEVPTTPRPLDVWVAGAPQEYQSNPFEATYSGEGPGTIIPATYVPLPNGHVQLKPGEADALDLQVVSRVAADLIFQVRVTYRIADQSTTQALILPNRYEVVFSDGSNWHLYQLSDGRFVPAGS